MGHLRIDPWTIGFTVLGLALIVIAIWWFVRATAKVGEAGRTWIKTSGTIVAASTERMTTLTGTDGWYASSKRFRPLVDYSFAADGDRRGSTAFLTGKLFYSEDQAQAWLATVQPGMSTDVWYDPADPDRSALQLAGPERLLAIYVAVTGAAVILIGYLFDPLG